MKFFQRKILAIIQIQLSSLSLFIFLTAQLTAQIRVSAINKHYLEYQHKPLLLITSAEHYGCLINAEFDYLSYLNALAASGMNLTRIFAGTTVEREADISWMRYRNTLAPKPNKLIAPWARSNEPGYLNAGNKFDLDKWDPHYFERLKAILIRAKNRGIIVELTLFGNQYKDSLWMNSPLHPANNIQKEGPSGLNSFLLFQTLKDSQLVKRQELFVKKIITELNSFDNLYYEICNEPYNEQKDSLSVDAWHHLIVQLIKTTERNLPKKHLIAINESVPGDSNVQVINYHYVYVIGRPSFDSLYHLRKVIGLDETLGSVIDADVDDVRVEAWDHILKAGGIYNNLSWEYTPQKPAGNDSAQIIRSYLQILQKFMSSFDYTRMEPVVYQTANADSHLFVRILAEKGKQYAMYLHHSETKGIGSIWGYDAILKEFADSITVQIPSGKYRMRYLNPSTGQSYGNLISFTHAGGKKVFETPRYMTDIAIQILKSK